MNGAATTQTPLSATVQLATTRIVGLNAHAAQTARVATTEPVTTFSVMPTPDGCRNKNAEMTSQTPSATFVQLTHVRLIWLDMTRERRATGVPRVWQS